MKVKNKFFAEKSSGGKGGCGCSSGGCCSEFEEEEIEVSDGKIKK